MRDVKILIYTTMWGRHTISKLWALSIKRFIKDAPKNVTVEVLVVGSTNESRDLCKANGFNFLFHKNRPLGQKWNYGIEHAIDHLKWDYVMIMGSDDLIGSEAWGLFKLPFQEHWDYFGFSNIYFYSPYEDSAYNFTYTGRAAENKLIGCGRLISRKAIITAGRYVLVRFRNNFSFGFMRYEAGEATKLPLKFAKYLSGMKWLDIIDGPEFSLWDYDQEKGLDNVSEMNLAMAGYYPKPIFTEKPIMVDIKGNENINPFSKYMAFGTKVDVEEALHFLPFNEIQFINENMVTKAS